MRWAVPSAHRMSLRWIALTDPDDHDTVVGCGTLQLTLKDNLTSAGLFVVVTPGHRRRGIGSQLSPPASNARWPRGAPPWSLWASQPGGFDEDSLPLTPQEGTGAMDGDSATARFMLAHGYRLEQVEVHSMLRVPVDRAVIDPLEADAAAKVGDAYRLVGWAGRCPDELVDAFARLRVAMADAPTAGLEYEAEHWDAARVREVEQRVSEGGLVALTTAAQHVASGSWSGTHIWSGSPIASIRRSRRTRWWSLHIAATAWACGSRRRTCAGSPRSGRTSGGSTPGTPTRTTTCGRST